MLWNNDLTGWDFSGQDLSYSRMGGTDLSNANLTEANLSNSSMAGKSGGVNLTHANLTDANCANAFFYKSTLTNANLTGASLKNADLTVVGTLHSVVFNTATVYSQWTAFPVEFDPAAAGLSQVFSPAGDFNGDDVVDAADIDLLTVRPFTSVSSCIAIYNVRPERR